MEWWREAVRTQDEEDAGHFGTFWDLFRGITWTMRDPERNPHAKAAKDATVRSGIAGACLGGYLQEDAERSNGVME